MKVYQNPGSSSRIHLSGCRYLEKGATVSQNLSGRPLTELRKMSSACNVCIGSKRAEKAESSGKSYERQNWKNWHDRRGEKK